MAKSKAASAPATAAATTPASGSNKLPKTYLDFVSRFPKLAKAHEDMAKAADAVGPLDRKTCALIKIGISLGAGLESAVRSHVRRAREAGASDQEIEQAILLAMTTCGFPRTVAAWKWSQESKEEKK